MDELVVCSDLTKRFRRVTAVDGLDLTVGKGEVFGFLGPNGAGKSTTLRMMVGLVRPTRGTVKLLGHNVWKNRRAALKKTGALIEEPAFYKYLSGRDNLRIISSTGDGRSRKDIDEVLDTVGLLDRARDKVKSYSHGMRQRLGIALAIVGKPDLVLLDEPTNGLDPEGMKQVRDLIRRLSTDLGMTVFLSSHLLHEVEQICTRVAVINKGKVIESGKVKDLLASADSYEIRVDSTEKAAAAIERFGKASVGSVSGSRLLVELAGADVSELNRFLVENGVAVSALIPQKRSLEELYMKLMQDSNNGRQQ